MSQGLIHAYLSWEVSSISKLQAAFQTVGLIDLFYYINYFGDPRYCFLILAPLGYIFSRKLGESTLIMAAIAEHINTMLKWLSFGHRPYWWGQAFMPEENRPEIQQRRLTCESGPGLPSGHVMVSMVTYFVLVSYLLRHYNQSRKHIVGISCAYVVCILCVSLARLLLAAHFIHQVAIGTVVGIGICKVAHSSKLIERARNETVLASLLVFFSGAVVYTILWMSGLEPTWTEAYAVKYCARKEWIRLETTTLNALVRDAASLFGVWLTRLVAEQLEGWLPSDKELPLRTKLLSCILILPTLFIMDKSIHIPPSIFYQAVAVYWSVIPIVVWLAKGGIVLAENVTVKKLFHVTETKKYYSNNL